MSTPMVVSAIGAGASGSLAAAHLARRRRLRLTLDDGTSRPLDAAILATGHGSPSTSWAPTSLARSPQFVADPSREAWQPADLR